MANFNFLFSRKKDFDQSLIFKLAQQWKNEGISSILISGDLTCMASEKEFQQAKKLILFLKELGFTVYVLPGNHDVYTKKTCQNKTFFEVFKDVVDFKGNFPFNLKTHSVAGYELDATTYLVLLDATTFNRRIAANGNFTPEIERNFKDLLKEIPATASIIVAAHFPYESYKAPKAHLIHGNRLEVLLKNDPRIKLYLHGHRHIPEIKNCKTHLSCDSGSISHKKEGGYLRIECNDTEITTAMYKHGKGEHERKTISR